MNKVNVIKIGGSLLTTTNHLPRLQAYLEQFTEHSNLLICGGGLEVERIRQHQLQYNLRDKECHYNSIEVMDRNTRLICEKLGVTCHGNEQEQFIDMNRWASLVQPGPTQGLEVLPFFNQHESGSGLPRLPISWCVTSDSIAASFAITFKADLHLLKSTFAPTQELETLARTGYVDCHFPLIASDISSVRFVDLLH